MNLWPASASTISNQLTWYSCHSSMYLKCLLITISPCWEYVCSLSSITFSDALTIFWSNKFLYKVTKTWSIVTHHKHLVMIAWIVNILVNQNIYYVHQFFMALTQYLIQNKGKIPSFCLIISSFILQWQDALFLNHWSNSTSSNVQYTVNVCGAESFTIESLGSRQMDVFKVHKEEKGNATIIGLLSIY